MIETCPEVSDPTNSSRDAVLSRLSDEDQNIQEQDLASILDAFRHDQKIHRSLIARQHLPESIVERLVRLLACSTDVNELVRRHSKSEAFTVDLRSVRSRPDWWR
jgi:hypothetical protein